MFKEFVAELKRIHGERIISGGQERKEEIGYLETWRLGEVGWGGMVFFFLLGGDLRSGVVFLKLCM